MNKNLILYLLIRHGFASVQSGQTGFTYMRCKECSGDNENQKRSSFNTELVKHESGCDLAKVLKELKP
jgi:hypothetical protein